MKHILRFLLVILIPAMLRAQGVENVLVLVNENSADSVAIARHYAEKRNLPESNICRLKTVETETISREVFNRDIFIPAAQHLKSKSLQDRILFIVTTRGLPLIVEGAPGPAGGPTSLDSELAMLYPYLVFGQLGAPGRVENPYFTLETRKEPFRPFIRSRYDIYLVTRLTGASAEDAGLLVDRALKPAGDGSLALLPEFGTESFSKSAAAGTVGFGGSIADPGLGGAIRSEVLTPAYAAGYNLAESFYAASRYLGWKQVVIGDPLALAPGSPAPDRKKLAAEYRPGMNAETGLPEHLSRRRLDFLSKRYPASKEALTLLLQAEAAYERGDANAALPLVQKSLELDSTVMDSHLLQAKVLEGQGDFAGAFDSYKKSFDLGRKTPETLEKLSRLGLNQLGAAEKAAPYVRMLYAQKSRPDMETTALYVDLLLRGGKSDEARSLLQGVANRSAAPPAWVLATLGSLYRQTGNSELAQTCWKKALEILAADGYKIALPPESRLLADEEEIRRLLAPVPAGESGTGWAAALDSGSNASAGVAARPAAGAEKAALDQPARIIARTPIDHENDPGRQGGVVIRLLIDEMGQVVKADLVSGPRGFGEAALRSVRRWKFAPALQNGRAVESRLDLTVNE